MLEAAILIPFVSLFIERFLELIDTWWVSRVFPWWRFRPAPPPDMVLRVPDTILPMPLKGPKVLDTQTKDASTSQHETPESGSPGRGAHSHCQGEAPDQKTTSFGKIVHTIGASEIELKINTSEDAVTYLKPEKERHFRRLVYYIKKHGFHLLESQDELKSESKNLEKFPWRRLVKGEWEYLERHLAYQEKILDPPFRGPELSAAVGPVKDYITNRASPEKDESLIRMELLADYCYLRNQCTREAFALVKRRAYSLLGIVLGIIIALCVQFDKFFIAQLLSIGTSPSDALYKLASLVRTSLVPLAQYPIDPWGTVINVGAGMLMGLGSQTVHRWANYDPNPYRRALIQDPNIHARGLY